MSDDTIPLACNLTAMTPEQRSAYEAQKTQLRRALEAVEELPDGYVFRFANVSGLLTLAAAFLENERRCCPFLAFHLEAASNGSAVNLRVTGPSGTPDFLRDALAG